MPNDGRTPEQMSDGACCAHLNVKYVTTDNGDGTVRGRWRCGTCGLLFTPVVEKRKVNLITYLRDFVTEWNKP